jgi:hypothetical protein
LPAVLQRKHGFFERFSSLGAGRRPRFLKSIYRNVIRTEGLAQYRFSAKVGEAKRPLRAKDSMSENGMDRPCSCPEPLRE